MEYTRPVSVVPKGTALARYIQALGQAKGESRYALEISRHWRDTPDVAMQLELDIKTAVDPMSTSGGAASLVGYGPNAELVDLVRPLSIIGRLEDRMRRTPLMTRVPIEVSTLGAAWIPEGRPIPILTATLSTGSIDPFKAATATVLSMELMRSSSPDALTTIKNTVAASVAKFLDTSFVDPTAGLLAGERPAAVTYNGLFFTSTGSTAAAIESDLNGMMALLGSWIAPTWIVPARLARLLWKFGAPGMGANIMGIPAILSANTGNRIILLDAADILFADAGAEIGVSGQASLVMTDTPASSPMATELVSLWQRNLVSVRAIRFVSWLRAHSDSVVTMSISY